MPKAIPTITIVLGTSGFKDEAIRRGCEVAIRTMKSPLQSVNYAIAFEELREVAADDPFLPPFVLVESPTIYGILGEGRKASINARVTKFVEAAMAGRKVRAELAVSAAIATARQR